MIRVPVPLEAQPYEVWVGAGAAALLDDVLPGTAKRVAVVTQPGVPDLASTDRPADGSPRDRRR